jgi:ABC-2 type transport system permease protein
MRIQNISALFHKQFKDMLKNMPVMVLFIVFPIIAAVMTQAMKEQLDMGISFISIFATMHCVFTPIVSVASIISEEKEKNTLRVLIMSNVTLREYLFSIGGFTLIAILLTGSIFLIVNPLDLTKALLFLLSLGLGSLISIVLGMCIGLFSKNSAAANGLAVPFGMVFAFLPMLSNFNKTIESASKFTYGQQVSYLLAGGSLKVSGGIILCINLILLLIISALLFKRSITQD